MDMKIFPITNIYIHTYIHELINSMNNHFFSNMIFYLEIISTILSSNKNFCFFSYLDLIT